MTTPVPYSSTDAHVYQELSITAVYTPGIINPGTSTPTLPFTYSFPITDTITPTSTATATPTPSNTPTETATSHPTSFSVLPFIFNAQSIPTITPSPPETVVFCDSITEPISIPDNDPNGIDDYISVIDNRFLTNLGIYLNISHGAVGNLVVTLSNQDTGEQITALNFPGNPPGECSYNNIITLLDDRASQTVDNKCATYPVAISGIYLPTDHLSEFARKSVSATWRLNVSDHMSTNTGTLNHWCLVAELSNVLPAQTPPPTPVSLPSSAYVAGMSGQGQLLELDCESRSAVDWAKHYGEYIDELDFLYHLPDSDDPESGFVGDPNGSWGLIPPDDYGVHAPPVADILGDYGLGAIAEKYLRWDDLRAEIASGNPVIVWIIGGYSYNLVNGIPQIYTASSTGKTTIVGSHEHTVIVVGYSPDSVTVLNGSQFVSVPIEQFLDSWSVLQFMAIRHRP